MKILITTITIGLVLSACSGTATNNATNAKPVEPAKNTATTVPASTDGPEKVVSELFNAGKSGDLSKLSGLCMPDGTGDSDVKEVCSFGAAPADKAGKFKEYFGEGGIDGTPVIEGDTAKIKIKFGPAGAKNEEILLKKKDGKWYLAGM